MQAPAVDVLIHGAGPVGCALAMALRNSHLTVALVGSAGFRPEFRPIALSYASRLILERLGAWPGLDVTPIEAIHVSQQRTFGRAILRADDARVPALGYVTEYASLAAVLQRACADLLVEAAVPARCVVHAEGSAHDVREKRYAQDALVSLIETEPRATATAFERFTPEGPLALLPLEGRFAAIWSCPPARADRLAACSDDDFLQALRDAAGRAAGVPVRVHARVRQPLAARVHRARVGDRTVYIGNAAQTLHPVAGQGLNLGLRDAWELSRGFVESDDPGAPATLARFAARRALDARAAMAVTDALAGVFLGSNPIFRAARGLALTALDLAPAPRRFFARRMIFGPSALP